MYILGINAFYHDTSAALLKDGRIVAMAEEERFSRDKHGCGVFPHQAIDYCLRQAGITFADVAYLTFMHDIEAILEHDPTIEPFKSYFKSNRESYLEFRETFSLQQNYLREYCAARKIKLAIIPHHDCHLASAYYGSDFEEANIISIDGRGDTETAVLAYGKGAEIKKLLSIPMPHSLGLLYTAVTNLLGFRPFDGEGKVMGLAPYGKNRFTDFFSEVIRPTAQGFETIPDYYYPLTGGFLTGSCRLEKVFGPKRPPQADSVNGFDEDIACSLQVRTEEIVAHLAEILFGLTGCRNLCLAGGVALNAKMSGTLRKKEFIDSIYIQPIANDAGCAIGGPMQLYNTLTGRRPKPIDHLYLGPEYSNDEIRKILISEGLSFAMSGDISAESARMLAEGRIVGWYQGRMEVGPRALGNRSILANPADPAMKDTLNYRVKRREAWRPFASSMLAEYKDLYLENACDAPFMILNFDVTERASRELISGIHIDNTTRPQTVTEQANPRYHALIREFGKLTGVHAVLNTSFNLAGEPIVLTPQQAIHDFMSCDMDCLVLGDFYLEKRADKRAFSTGFTPAVEESKLSFDQYQRYRSVADLVQSLRSRRSCRILDIGSSRCELGEFLPYDSIIKLDKSDVQAPNLIQGDATDMPFKDGYFDFVVSCDCFEHLSPADRDGFLAEALRVSRNHVIIACPFAGNRVEESEELVNDYYKFLYGEANYNLVEHAVAGLPSLPELQCRVEAEQCRITLFDNGHLEHWLPLMVLNFFLEKHELWDVSSLLNRHYNRTFYQADNNAPAYRRIAVISKPAAATAPPYLPQAPPAGLKSVAESLFQALDSSIEADIALLRQLASHQEAEIGTAVAAVAVKEKALENFVQSIKEFVTTGSHDDKTGIAILRDFIEPFHPRPSAVLQYTSAAVQSDKPKVFRILAEYLKQTPDNGEAWNDLGALFLSENDFENAKKSLHTACLLDYPLAYRNLSAMYLIVNDCDNAAALTHEAIRKGIDPHVFADLGILH